jgi:predicted membrane protein
VTIEENKQLNALNIIFYIFALMTVITLAFYQRLTVYSIASFVLMMWIKQVGLGYRLGLNIDQIQWEIEELKSNQDTLSTRMDLIDPYKEKK